MLYRALQNSLEIGPIFPDAVTYSRLISKLENCKCPLLAPGCYCSPDNLRLQSIQRSLTHHRLQYPDMGNLSMVVTYERTAEVHNW